MKHMKKIVFIMALLLAMPGVFAYNTIVSLTITGITMAAHTCDQVTYTAGGGSHHWLWQVYEDSGVAKSEVHYADTVGGGVSSAVSVTSGQSYEITATPGGSGGDYRRLNCYLLGTKQGDTNELGSGWSFNYIA